MELREDFDNERAINAVLYIAEKLDRKIFHKIFKILYFSDIEHLVKYGRTITGDVYIRMLDGPVPSALYDIFLLHPAEKADLDYLSETDIECINISFEKYSSLSWAEIRELSHNQVWQNTVINKPISLENMYLVLSNDLEYLNFIKENLAFSNALKSNGF